MLVVSGRARLCQQLMTSMLVSSYDDNHHLVLL